MAVGNRHIFQNLLYIRPVGVQSFLLAKEVVKREKTKTRAGKKNGVLGLKPSHIIQESQVCTIPNKALADV